LYKGGRFLEVVALVDDDRKGIIWIPKACSGQGWRRFVSELHSWLAALDSTLGSSSEGSMPEESSSGSLQVVKVGRSYTEVMHSPSGEAVVSVGPKLFLSREINLLTMVNRAELVVCATWDSSEEENGCLVPPQVKVAALGRRKMRKHLGFLNLGLGLGKLGLGFPNFVYGLGLPSRASKNKMSNL
jgi:hypothetical protein